MIKWSGMEYDATGIKPLAMFRNAIYSIWAIYIWAII